MGVHGNNTYIHIFSTIGICLNCIYMAKYIYMYIKIHKIYVYPCTYIFGVIGIVLKWVPIEISKVCMGKSSHICK